jgi:hypothetical protein
VGEYRNRERERKRMIDRESRSVRCEETYDTGDSDT